MLIACSTAFGLEKLLIDSFDLDGQSRQFSWQPQMGCLPPEECPEDEKGILLRCDFSNRDERCIWDKEVNLNLSKFGRFSLLINTENPRSIRNGTIYFQSGNGWYSANLPAERKGWKKVSIPKGNFRSEGNPTGWQSINRIRLSFWKSGDINTVVSVRELEAIADDIMVVLGNLTAEKSESDARSARDYHRNISKILDDSGIDFGSINDTDVELGALSGCKIAIFPYNNYMSSKELLEIEKFAKAGGKIMLFYTFPEKLEKYLGIGMAGWEREKSPGEFSFINFDPKVVEGKPKTIYQGSWNVRIPKPINEKTKIAGYWADANGKVSDIPAITVNPGGAYMGHVFLSNDPLNKRQMFFALLGYLVPDMREYLSKIAIQYAGKLNNFSNLSEVSSFIEDNAAKIPQDRRIKSLEHLAESKKFFDLAEHLSSQANYGDILNAARKASDELHSAFFMSLPSKEGEFRAAWAHSPFGVSGWEWDRAISHLKKSGFNAIFANMLRAGITYYPSGLLPESQESKQAGDQIARCVEAAKKYGVQLHIWKVNWYLSRAPEEFLVKMRKEGRLQKDKQGKEVAWLCPSDKRNQDLERESMLEVVKKYNVDGIHFDYIRYPDQNSCYCSGCKKRFEESKKVKINKWPEEVVNGKYKDDFIQWRCDQITNLVKSVSQEARKIKPEIKISAAVFKDYPASRVTVGQDWKAWIEAGYLDFVCPMNYTIDDDQFRNIVMAQSEAINKRVPLYPGIGASAPGLPPAQVAMQIYITRDLGLDGFVIFNYDLQLAEQVLTEFSKGLTSSE